MFLDINDKVGAVAADVGKTPIGWNGQVFSFIKSINDSVVIPIAGLIITAVLCIELINMVMQKNNMHDTDTFEFFKYIIKMWIAVWLVSHAFTFSMAVFDVAQHMVNHKPPLQVVVCSLTYVYDLHMHLLLLFLHL
ncbi:VirB6/TrbL-like conjugal transfer protein, CD1112 family [Fusobacterium animalis]|uniref:VirB6/TrbL-like conjugal transfer protein, CD1112 family n=1 Tax=Fusobacterium animalis TaxID=76859 RepID=UPI0035569F13